jgi:aspartyl-tRNA(Asn)/glutamyl-tRNA(Gln) amidotransferase subunit B
VSPALLGALVARIADGTLTNSAARTLFDALWSGEGAAPTAASAAQTVEALIDTRGLRPLDDPAALQAIVEQVVAANPRSVDEWRAGKQKALNALVGQVMKASGGKANPAQAGELLRRLLGSG